MMELWIKALHVMSVIAWMAGIFYLPRLYVYHVTATPGGELSETLKTMERKLLKVIMTPAMIATWVFGIWIAVLTDAFTETWFQLKFVAVIAMTVFHAVASTWRKEFEADANTRSERFYRLANEVPTLLMVVIVLLVVVRPI